MKQPLSIGYIFESNRKIVGYSKRNNSTEYVVECLNCGIKRKLGATAAKKPCKKCSYVKNVKLQDLRLQIEYKYKYNANLKNIKYDLSFEKFCELISNECFYCGQKPNTTWSSYRKKENKIIYNGIDRKNNNLGYSEENTVSCCKFCNIAKKAHPLSLWKEKVKAWSKRVDSW
jgi:hypothetical protein